MTLYRTEDLGASLPWLDRLYAAILYSYICRVYHVFRSTTITVRAHDLGNHSKSSRMATPIVICYCDGR